MTSPTPAPALLPLRPTRASLSLPPVFTPPFRPRAPAGRCILLSPRLSAVLDARGSHVFRLFDETERKCNTGLLSGLCGIMV